MYMVDDISVSAGHGDDPEYVSYCTCELIEILVATGELVSEIYANF